MASTIIVISHMKIPNISLFLLKYEVFPIDQFNIFNTLRFIMRKMKPV